MGKFCKFCGKQMEGANCVCGNQSNEAAGYVPPSGYTLDPGSGLYYNSIMGSDPATGKQVQLVTWFDPKTGEYQEVSYPAAPEKPAPAPSAVKPPPIASAMSAVKSASQGIAQSAAKLASSDTAQSIVKPEPVRSAPSAAKPASGECSPKSKTIMLILTIFGFHLGFGYFYLGLNKKGLLLLLLYWPFMVLGWIFFFAGGFLLVIAQLSMFVMTVKDVIKMYRGELYDGQGRLIVN